jgi:hypothetical protein
MIPIFKYPKSGSEIFFSVNPKILGQLLVKACFLLAFLFSMSNLHAQIKVPNMIVPNDTWGLIDANNIFGGCMQVDNHTKMLQTDVQFLKRGMLFVVYDDDDVAPGAQTKIYLFSPLLSGPKSWAYNNPFSIPAVRQNLNIISAGLSNYLIPLNITTNKLNTPPTMTNVYYDTSNNTFYRYVESSDPGNGTYEPIVLQPKASDVTVVAQNNIESTNVQAALEELNDFKEYTIATDGEATVTLLFNLKANSQIFYNGSLLESSQWSGVGTKTLGLSFGTMKFDKVRIQR